MPTILEIIESRLIPDEQAKKARGEVFTPLKLVRELLYGIRKSDFDNGDILPWGVNKEGDIAEDDEDDRIGGIPLELWRDPDTKWLDPANGIGNFPFIAFQMLDYQLKHHGTKGSNEWSDERRKRHIIGNMLYMIEIDRGNVNTSVKIFRQLVPGLTANVYCGDALTANIKSVFNVEKFDVVMGNPPFQSPGEKRTGTTAAHGSIWDKFITDISFKILISGGYLAFITPYAWRKPENLLWKEMAHKRHLTYLHILSKSRVMNEMKVSIGVDMYIIQNATPTANTSVIDEKGQLHSLNSLEWEFMPNYKLDVIKNIISSEPLGIKVIYNSFYDSRKVSQTQTETHIFPVVHTITQQGLGLRYTNDNTRGHFGVSKVLLNKNERQYPYNDFEGKYGMSELTFGIPITSKEEGDAIVEAINSDEFKEIIKATKWSTFQTEYKMFKYFRPDFYKEFLKKSEEGGTRHSTPRKKKSSRVTRRNS